jgi:predicted lipoprotein with Yx(FWY)xxD motif
MTIPMNRLRGAPARRLLYGGLVLGAVATAAACGSSSPKTSASSSPKAPASSSGAASPGAAASASATVSATSVPGLGTVLVNGQGRTLYILSSEKGGKVTCTAASGCTKFWPPVELSKGMMAAKAGNGVQQSMLGVAKGPNGVLYATYNHWPLYTYAGDSAPGQAHGQGIRSFGGTWYALSASGSPVTGTSHPKSSPSSGGGGYGY